VVTAPPVPLAHGFGLSYTSFSIDDVQVALVRKAAAIHVRAAVQNTGAQAGGHIVQVYARRPSLRTASSSGSRGWR
jgi:hypothetical protein